jgi:hypothetical protein
VADLFRREVHNLASIGVAHSLFTTQQYALEDDLHDLQSFRILIEERLGNEPAQLQ